jgi:hypothetical protein
MLCKTNDREMDMSTISGSQTGLAVAALLLSLVFTGTAFAGSNRAPGNMWLACENGRNYPLRPVAVSREGDLVTGYMLYTGRRHGVHLRLVPMGVGYRYEGAGIWFDGLRGNAVLNWGPWHSVPCTVEQEQD